jgi:hypothetical protein
MPPAVARPIRFDALRIDPLRAAPLRIGNEVRRGPRCSGVSGERGRLGCAESEHAGNHNSEGKPLHAVSLSRLAAGRQHVVEF